MRANSTFSIDRDHRDLRQIYYYIYIFISSFSSSVETSSFVTKYGNIWRVYIKSLYKSTAEISITEKMKQCRLAML